MGEEKETLERTIDVREASSSKRSGEVPHRLEQALASADPAEVFSWLSSGDPLGIYALGATRVRTRYFILEPDRVYDRSVAVFAYRILDVGGLPDEDDRNRTMDRVIEYLLDDDRQAEAKGEDPPELGDARYALLVDAMAVRPERARQASVEFNNLPERTRRAFYQLLIDNQHVDEALAEGTWTRELLRDDLRDALATLGHWEHHPPTKGGKR